MSDHETRLFYDLTARATAEAWYENAVLMPALSELSSLLPEHPRILDLGCGPGHESMRLASTGAEVVGIDFSPECIRIARERCPQCRFEVMDFRRLDDASLGMFDAVLACGSLIHVDGEHLAAVMGEVHRVLKPNGYLLAIVRNGKGVLEKHRVIAGRPLHRTVYLHSRDSLENHARGFRYVRGSPLPAELNDAGWRSHLLQRAAVRPSGG